ncbi:MAG: YceI family protein [Bacteroidota bacterium]
MFGKKHLWGILACVALTAFVNQEPAKTQKWVITQNSSLSVNGTTNINKFTCDIPSYGQTDTITLVKSRNYKSVVLSGSIGLKTQSFDCHNAMMTRDLRKTLKANQYPILRIRFLSISNLPVLTNRPEPITGLVAIAIAGVSKQFEVNYQIAVDEQNTIHLLGSRDVNFSDFELIPPRKLGGMIKTNDKLSVAFHLKINPIR